VVEVGKGLEDGTLLWAIRALPGSQNAGEDDLVDILLIVVLIIELIVEDIHNG
jgi:hypothetical protein